MINIEDAKLFIVRLRFMDKDYKPELLQFLKSHAVNQLADAYLLSEVDKNTFITKLRYYEIDWKIV